MFMASPLVFAWYLKFASEDIISPLLSCLTPSDCFPEDSSSPGRSLVEVKRERSANLDVNSCFFYLQPQSQRRYSSPRLSTFRSLSNKSRLLALHCISHAKPDACYRPLN